MKFSMAALGISITIGIAAPAYAQAAKALQGCPENAQEAEQLFRDRPMLKEADRGTYQFPSENLTMFGKSVLGLFSDQRDSDEYLKRIHFRLDGAPSTYVARIGSKYQPRAASEAGPCGDDWCSFSFEKKEKQLRGILMRHEHESDGMPEGTYLTCYYEY